jgi:hypothetical protein
MAQIGLPNAQRSKRMREILQQDVVPALRSLGFQSTLPHFYRVRAARLDLLNVQFSYQGQHFFINLGRLELPSDASGTASKPTRKQLNVANCPFDQRTRLAIGVRPQRLGGSAVPGFDMWDFAAETDAEAEDLMHRLARQLREFLLPYADPWWQEEKLKAGLPPRPIGPGISSSNSST